MYFLKRKLRFVFECSRLESTLSGQMVSSDSGELAPKFWFDQRIVSKVREYANTPFWLRGVFLQAFKS